jgi:spermidine synthase
MIAAMGDVGFQNFRTLPFPQPCYPTGWWSCTMASKQARDLTRFRLADAAAKRFGTEYYNAGVHAGALAQPEFMKRALAQK